MSYTGRNVEVFALHTRNIAVVSDSVTRLRSVFALKCFLIIRHYATQVTIWRQGAPLEEPSDPGSQATAQEETRATLRRLPYQVPNDCVVFTRINSH
jgi:hypothetical protein